MKRYIRDYIDLQIEAIKESIAVAHGAMEKRLDGMNEFRSALRDQAATLIGRGEFNAFKDKIEGDIQSLRESRAELRGKANQSSVIFFAIVSIFGLIFSLVSLILRLIER